VNLGAGLPVQVANYLGGPAGHPAREERAAHYGCATPAMTHPRPATPAGGQFVTLRPGTAFFDSVTSFEIALGGRLTPCATAPTSRRHRDLATGRRRQMSRRDRGAMAHPAGASQRVRDAWHTDSRWNPSWWSVASTPHHADCWTSVITTGALRLARGRRGSFLRSVEAGFSVGECCLDRMTSDVAARSSWMQEQLASIRRRRAWRSGGALRRAPVDVGADGSRAPVRPGVGRRFRPIGLESTPPAVISASVRSRRTAPRPRASGAEARSLPGGTHRAATPRAQWPRRCMPSGGPQ